MSNASILMIAMCSTDDHCWHVIPDSLTAGCQPEMPALTTDQSRHAVIGLHYQQACRVIILPGTPNSSPRRPWNSCTYADLHLPALWFGLLSSVGSCLVELDGVNDHPRVLNDCRPRHVPAVNAISSMTPWHDLLLTSCHPSFMSEFMAQSQCCCTRTSKLLCLRALSARTPAHACCPNSC